MPAAATSLWLACRPEPDSYCRSFSWTISRKPSSSKKKRPAADVVLPARLRLVADYVSREDALEREAAAELLDECAARLEAQRDRLARCNADVLHALGCGCQLVAMPAAEEVRHA